MSHDADTSDTASRTLGVLSDPALDDIFRTPARLDVDSAWYGHIPFAQWLVPAISPRRIVELGTHAGVSYSTLCESVRAAGLPTQCVAIDTWKGDDQAGIYPEQVYTELKAFHDARYGSFSTLLRCRFDEALSRIADGSIDLLHIDGRHHEADVRADYASWIPKLSPRAVVLFHDTQVRESHFAVWKIWEELAPTRPSFEFLHAYGLGVLCHGTNVPAALAELCASDAERTATIRARFSRLGERWAVADTLRQTDARAAHERAGRESADKASRTLKVQLAGAQSAAGIAELALHKRQFEEQRLRATLVDARHAAELQLSHAREAISNARIADTNARAAERRANHAERRAQDAERLAQHAESQLHHARAAPENLPWGRDLLSRISDLEQTNRDLANDKNIILGSTSWRLTRPLRALRGHREPSAVALEHAASPAIHVAEQPSAAHVAPAVSEPDRTDADTAPIEPMPAHPATPPAEHDEAACVTAQARDKILFVSGESHTPGHQYRCVRNAEAARRSGSRADWVTIQDVRDSDLDGCRLVVLWRVPCSQHVETLCMLARGKGASVAFDIDDLMIRPDFATTALIDGIRSTNSTEDAVRNLFVRIRQTIDLVDFCLCTTEELAFWMRGEGHDTYVVPNTFDDATWRASRRAAHSREPDGILRIGYAGGTRTHQKDFSRAAPALARFLRARPDSRLVLFRDPASGEGLVLAEEFGEIPPGSIEWRDMVPLSDLPDEMARFDINIVPLETGNVFAEAKSELKFFEAALVGIPTIASPTGPFARAIRDGITGFLAKDDASWLAHLETLADDAALRKRLGHAAYLDCLAGWGPVRAVSSLRETLALRSGGAVAASAFQLKLLRRAMPPAPVPDIPAHDTIVTHGRVRDGDAAITVIVPLYNYAQYILETLESVRRQTIENLDLIVIDDGSSDESLALAEEWFAAHHQRFRRARLLRNRQNSKLGPTRNVGFDRAETPYVLPLDADNRLRPECCARLLEALEGTDIAFAHSLIRTFGDRNEVLGERAYTPNGLIGANTIDAMALIAKSAWAAAGGYDHVRFGWEDYDLWCRFAERGLAGVQVAEELADYRTHSASMIHEATEQQENRFALIDDMERRHDWLRLTGRRG